MPFLADLDQPEPPRWRGVAIGVAIALPLTLTVGALVLPRFRAAFLSAADDHDRHARQRDAYMFELCGAGIDVDRDEKLCACVLGAEYPSLDCMDRFRAWLLERQIERCEAPAVFKTNAGFCSCVIAVGENVEALANTSERRQEASTAYLRCQGLDDALEPPPVETLLRAF